MTEPGTPPKGLRFPRSVLVAIISATIVIASFPNPLVPRGLGFLAWIALVPVLACLAGSGILSAVAAGAVYGAAFALGSQYWLASYALPALVLAALLSALQFALLFPLLSLSFRKLRFAGPAAAAAIWTLFEYAKSRGSLAFPFGTLGLGQYGYPFLVGIAALSGVFLVSFLIVLANASLALWVSCHLPSRTEEASRMPRGGGRWSRGRLELALASTLLLGACLASGAWHKGAEAREKEGKTARAVAVAPASIRIALVQHGHGKQGNAGEYRAAFEDLRSLTDETLAGKPDLVVWPESAIVPSINWHLAMREDRELYDLAREADGYASRLPCPLLFGNDLAETRPGADPAHLRIDRNAAILRHGASTQAYAKTRLVPFAEEVPPALADTGIGKYALELSSGGWARGVGPVLLDLGSSGPAGAAGANEAAAAPLPRLSFGTPICFEDGFGDYCLGFARQGASFLAVLTSDSWAHSASCEYQHLAQSVFRSAETGLPVVRAASTGITALILPDGRIAGELPPFSAASLVVDLPLRESDSTPYGRVGDGATLLAGFAALLALCLALARELPVSRRRPGHGPAGGAKDAGPRRP